MRTAMVVGTGLVGTSLAMALVRRGVTVHLRDRSATAAGVAAGLGAGVLEPPEGPVDVAVVAVPPAAVGAVVGELQRGGTARAYTDVASVKAHPQYDVEAFADAGSFIGGHPLAGGARSGPLGANGSLFEGRPWVLAPSEATSRATLNTALELVSVCGAVPVVMDADRHDKAVALMSHAPHVVAAVMAARLEGAPSDATRLAGQGIRDVTRIAASDPVLWEEILTGNSTAVADVLEAAAADLTTAVEALRSLGAADEEKRAEGSRALTGVLRRGNSGHACLPVKHGAVPAVFGEVEIGVADEPGELAGIFSAVGRLGVNVEDMTIEHATATRSGLLRLLVDRGEVRRVAERLTEEGWPVRD
ncbi:prephenate dehydrogenase [Streptomyces sp. NPDC047928]|uniref:prephenate dehydrogenase n=1 Tax=unclassified Streptomyces TaxID=2593676 RepID=UPI0037236E7A